ncbi:hypothetical protein [Roseateles sp.]|uniref:RHS repeat domain-containing protein n=1 Tax=Roseateles sp. TaxID=1971397 RepID=UPI003267DAA0
MRANKKQLTLLTMFFFSPVFASTLDFEGGSTPGVTITGEWSTLSSVLCGGNGNFVPTSGCKALVNSPNPLILSEAWRKVIFDVADGFSRLSFYVAAASRGNAKMTVYSGAGGTGQVLLTKAMPGPGCTSEPAFFFCDAGLLSFQNLGGARSVVFEGRDSGFMLDDVEFSGDIEVATNTVPPRQCPILVRKGNPIEPLTGKKIQTIDLGVSLGGIPLALHYDSNRAIYPASKTGRMPSFGGGWTASWLRSIVSLSDIPESGQSPFRSFRPDGREESFITARSNPSAWKAYSGDADYVELRSGTVDYHAIQEALIESYSASVGGWRPTKLASASGGSMGIMVSSAANPVVLEFGQVIGLPTQLFDDRGRTVTLQYQQIPLSDNAYANAKVIKMTLPDGGFIQFGYSDQGNLTSIRWPDGSTMGLTYQEEDPRAPDPAIFYRLWTGVIDESGKRFSTFGYDSSGRAISTEHAGGVDAYSTSYSAPPSLVADRIYDADIQRWVARQRLTVPTGVMLTDPNGSTTQLGVEQVANTNAPVSFSQPGGSGCAPSTRTQSFDSKGNLVWRENFKGNRTCYANDSSRNLETGRIEGLATGSSCDALLMPNAALPGNSRRTSTQWHPVWRQEIKVAEPRRLTTKIYNGQPDPFNGGATASCAPSNATLPDGSPIVVLCKQVEQATTDANGALGLSATVDTSVPTRVQQWTYNQYGQVLTAKDPLNTTTTSTYYSDTTADHTMGDLATVTNALNQVVARYTKYNPMGQWLEMADANGVATTRTFDLRQRLKSTMTAGLTTSYDYWPTGLLKSVTMPDTSSVNYGYDDAHRLTSLTDNLGNKVTYTLDNSGNRISETVSDPGGRLAKTLTRVPDALNRIQQITGRE